MADANSIILKAPVDTEEVLQTIFDAGFTEITSPENVLTLVLAINPVMDDMSAKAWRDA